MARVALEIAANSLASALAAEAGGADRIELCANLAEGGVTPSPGTLAMVRERVSLPVVVLVRPRGGDFVHDADELETMRRDVAHCAALGFEGVAIGVLTPSGDVDREACARLIEAAGRMRVTFHRAFDRVREREQALETVLALGCARLLTSGGAPTAEQGVACIAASVRQAAGRLEIIAGAGVRPANAAAILAAARPDALHSSASALLEPHADTSGRSILPGLEASYRQTEAAQVRVLARAIARAGQGA